jgi:hypothetical protein
LHLSAYKFSIATLRPMQRVKCGERLEHYQFLAWFLLAKMLPDLDHICEWGNATKFHFD